MKSLPVVRHSWRLILAFLLALFVAPLLPRTVQQVAAQTEPPRTVFVHLFEWKWLDVAEECENFLGPKGFSAVQVSPPNEHAIVTNYPWWQRYQPVSYQLQSRSGTRAQFIEMVQRCNAVGVSIYVDAVINHMTGVGAGVGSAGSSFGVYSYPFYGYSDFHHCGRNGNDDIANYGDRWEVQNCELVNLADLNTGATYVRSQIVAYLQDLVNIGVAGFRVDAAKHMDTNDIHAIFAQVTGNYYVFQEVIEGAGEPITGAEYFQNGDVTEFDYSKEIGRVFKTGSLSWLSQFGESWGFMTSANAVVFVDNHDNQRGGGNIVTYKDGTLYNLTNVFMLAWPYGYPKVMSSFYFSSSDQSPPYDGAGNTRNVYSDYNNPNSYDCGGSNWVCEHRRAEIANMVEFRNVTSSAFTVNNWWSNGSNQIAFSRGNLGFVAINKESSSLTRSFQTGLPAGTYCNVTNGQLNAAGTGCTGSTVTVASDGTANITLASWTAVAIHVNDKTSGGGGYAKTYPQVYFRGTANAWATTAMELVGNYTWRTTATFTGASNDRFKFDIYGDWTLNFGDTNNDGIANQSGSDIAITNGAGVYTITFNDQTKAYTVTGGGGAPTGIATAFSVSGAYTSAGQNVYVVGNVAALGSWNPCSAVKLSPTAYPTWTGTVNLPASTAIEYKYVKYYDGNCATVVWQSGANKTFTTPGTGTVTRTDAW